MPSITLNEQDKKELLEYLTEYASKVSEKEINELSPKLTKKLSLLRKKKHLPSYVGRMISQICFLQELLESQEILVDKRNKIVAGLHYFIVAEDRIPDYIPAVGYLDDAFIISTIYQDVRKK